MKCVAHDKDGPCQKPADVMVFGVSGQKIPVCDKHAAPYRRGTFQVVPLDLADER